MFILKKILAPFLMLPGIFIGLLICSGVWFSLRKQWKAGLLNCSIGIFMWALSLSPVSDMMVRGLESDFKIPKNPHGDVIILLGGGVSDKAPDLTGVGAPSGDMLERTVTAVRIQKRLNVPIIVTGGVVFKGKAAEAPIVKRFLVDLGVPSERVIIEDKARDTIENAKYSKEICEKDGYKNPILVTSAYHMKRAVLSFKKVDMDVLPFPAGFRTWENKKYGWESYLPGGFEDVNTAIHEYLGLLLYRFAY